MASDYAPIFKPGEDITVTASAPITAGQLVAVTGPYAVAPTAAATGAWMGVATQDAATGAQTVVTGPGVHELICLGAVADGALVMAASQGRVATFSGTDYSQLVGKALKGAAGGAKAEIHIR